MKNLIRRFLASPLVVAMKKNHFLFYLFLSCFGIFIILLPNTPIPQAYYPYFLFLFLLITAICASVKTYRDSDSLYSKILAGLILIPPMIYFVVAVMPA